MPNSRKGEVVVKRRRLRPDARRVELLQAALRVLREKGPLDARVEDVTEAAGAAKGTFYLYFSSWDDLLIQIRGHLLSTYVSEMHKRFAAAVLSDWWTAFERECIHFIDFVVELGDLHKAIFHGPVVDRSLDAAPSAEALLAGMLRTGIDSGACRTVEVDAAAPLLFSLLHTTADNVAQKGNREHYLAAMFDLLRAWLRTPASAVTEQKTSSHKGDGAND